MAINQTNAAARRLALIDMVSFAARRRPRMGNAREGACGAIVAARPLRVRAILIIHEHKGMITGESAAPEVHSADKAPILARPGMDRVIHPITVQRGSQLMVAAQAPRRAARRRCAGEAINTVEEIRWQRWLTVKWCFFEPTSSRGMDCVSIHMPATAR